MGDDVVVINYTEVSRAIRIILAPLPCMFSDYRFKTPMEAVRLIISKVRNDLSESAWNAMDDFLTELERKNISDPEKILEFWREKLAE